MVGDVNLQLSSIRKKVQKIKSYLLITMLFSFMVVVSPFDNYNGIKAEPSSMDVGFECENLEMIIRDALEISEPYDVTREDMKEITTLNSSSTTINSLSGLEYAIKLERLTLSGSWYIKDLSPISDLTNLEQLNLRWNSISDLSPLSELTNLRTLNLYGNLITDLESLPDLPKLEELFLIENYIKNLNPLPDLPNLQRLHLTHNLISDLSPLAKLTNLEILGLGWNSINDISSLPELPNLKELYLADNNIADLSPLSHLLNLRFLNLSGNSLTDLSTLPNIAKLNSIDLQRNYLRDITALDDNFLNLDRVLINQNYLDVSEGSETIDVIYNLLDRGIDLRYSSKGPVSEQYKRQHYGEAPGFVKGKVTNYETGEPLRTYFRISGYNKKEEQHVGLLVYSNIEGSYTAGVPVGKYNLPEYQRVTSRDKSYSLLYSENDLLVEKGETVFLDIYYYPIEYDFSFISLAKSSVTDKYEGVFDLDDIGVRIELTKEEQASGSINVSRYRNDYRRGSPRALSPSGVFLDINCSESLDGSYIRIEVDYEPDELNAGIIEDTLQLYRFDNKTDTWKLASDQGINKNENYIWAKLDEFSHFGVFGDGLFYGDVAASGTIDVADAILILRHIVGLDRLVSDQLLRARVSSDYGEVDVGDAIIILRYIVGLIDEFPVKGDKVI